MAETQGQTENVSSLVPLACLRPGECAEIRTVEGNAEFSRRLTDLGFVPGTMVRVRRNAPLRDPVEYEVRDCRVCLRRAEAQAIGVLPCPAVPREQSED